MSIRVAIVEDSRPFRESVELVLTLRPGFEHVGSFGSVEELSDALDDPTAMVASWNIVLMDIDLPGASGIEGIRLIKRRFPMVSVIVCTVFEEPGTILDAISAGADGYLLKSAGLSSLMDQLHSVVAGGSSLSATVARSVMELVRRFAPDSPGTAPTRIHLTGRERDVLRGLVSGGSYKQVADDLGISVHTVRTHIRALYKKLQVQNVAEAVSRAVRERLV
ncbi:MAG: DNA-binding NarL/FixJ family response regulator [Kiritimatiellia bacterium]|jgi:DNA-binding NarL/FixJ family response regulator